MLSRNALRRMNDVAAWTELNRKRFGRMPDPEKREKFASLTPERRDAVIAFLIDSLAREAA